MKKLIKIILMGSMCGLLSQCVTYSVNKSKLISPIPQDVPNITEKFEQKQLRIKPFVYYKNNSHRYFRDDESYSNNYNVNWHNEDISIGSSTELNVSPHFNFEYGILFSQIEGKIFLSHELGWGARRTFLDIFGIRIDNLVTAYNQRYNSELVREDSDGEDTYYYKKDSRIYLGMVTSITINSLKEMVGLNYFLSLERGYYKYFFSGNYFSGISGGIYKNISDKFRIIGDVKYCYYDIYDYQDPNQLTYMITFDYDLGNIFSKKDR